MYNRYIPREEQYDWAEEVGPDRREHTPGAGGLLQRAAALLSGGGGPSGVLGSLGLNTPDSGDVLLLLILLLLLKEGEDPDLAIALGLILLMGENRK